MADQPDTSGSATGAAAAPEVAARTGIWGIGLAALGLAAVVAGMAAGVGSVSGTPRPPDLGGPILAPSAVSTPASASTATSAPLTGTLSPVPGRRRPGQLPPQVLARADGTRASAARAATPVPVRALPVPPTVQPTAMAAAPGGAPAPAAVG
ncbi:hypothetical protein [Frankia canadensis]|nr:hypothetical protein [Frankia canadensis]